MPGFSGFLQEKSGLSCFFVRPTKKNNWLIQVRDDKI